MMKRDSLDLSGAAWLIVFAVLMAVNQLVVKFTNEGFQPVFMAGLRSLGAAFCMFIWIKLRGIRLRTDRAMRPAALMIGIFFSFQFLFLFMALDLTSVSRSALIFYTMPVWLALAGHFLIPGERLTPNKVAGLVLCVAGVATAMLDRQGGTASLAGDLCALGGAMSWAAVATTAKISALKTEPPEAQLFWQTSVSAPILLIMALFFGPLLRDLQPVHLAGLAFQAVIVVACGFLLWFWLLANYPASTVGSFVFLAPVFSVIAGWLVMGDTVGVSLLIALGLVGAGILLINRPRKV